jgi:hypothetical protein
MDGVMERLVEPESWNLAFSNTPILQYSKTTRGVYGQSN